MVIGSADVIKSWGDIDSPIKEQINAGVSFRLQSFQNTHTLILVNNSDLRIKVDMQRVYQFTDKRNTSLLEDVYFYGEPHSESTKYLSRVGDGSELKVLDFIQPEGKLHLTFVVYANTDESAFDYLARNQSIII